MATDYYLQTSTPITYPVTQAEAKAWCRITWESEDDLIDSLIVAATEKAELYTNRVFIERTYTGKFAWLECPGMYEKGPYLALRRAPVSAVASVKVYVEDVLETISTDDYNLKQTSGFPRIIFVEVNDNPDDIPYPYEVAFTAGYGAAADVPSAIKTAILETICYWFSNRGDCGCGSGNELPSIAKGILSEYKILNTFA